MKIPPPVHSTRVAGTVVSAQLLDFQLKHPRTQRSVAQRLGLAYERKALVHLAAELEGTVLMHPAFRFNSGQVFDQHAIPDAIYLNKDNSALTIFEIKLKHTPDAWHQLHKLYYPIISKVYPGVEINLCEVCRNYDPSIRLPDTEIVESLAAFTSAPRTAFGVYIWSGRI